MHGYNGFGFGGGWMMIIWWILIIVVIVYLFRWLAPTSAGWPGTQEKSNSDRALEILKERYARGEIDKEEYERKKRELQD